MVLTTGNKSIKKFKINLITFYRHPICTGIRRRTRITNQEIIIEANSSNKICNNVRSNLDLT